MVKDYHFRSLHQAIDPMVLFWEPSYISYYFIKLNPAQRSEMIAYHGWRAARRNPVEALRYE